MLSTIETTKYVYQGSSPSDITIDNCKCCCLAVLIRLVAFYMRNWSLDFTTSFKIQAAALAKDVSIKGWKSTPHNNYPI